MSLWATMLEKFEKDKNMYLLVLEEDDQVIASVQMAIIENLTHNVRPFAIIENVVTHADHRNEGMPRRCLQRQPKSPKKKAATKYLLEQAPTRKAR